MDKKYTMEEIVNHAKSRGFVYPNSEIYGGLSNTWDYGPLGVLLKNNIKKEWIKKFVQEEKTNVLIDASILMNPMVWKASGHIDGFSDPLIDCKKCKCRHRADKLIENWMAEHGIDEVADGWSNEKMVKYLYDNNIVCPECGALDYTDIRAFNLMFKTFQGVTEEKTSEIFLRPETAQGIFVNFKNVLRTTRRNLPMGIAQIGKSFRNEITPGNFIFRTREFEQMELEFFCSPKEDDHWFNYWKNKCSDFVKYIGIKDENVRFRKHSDEELSHYSKETYDIEYKFPFGFGEMWGIANRTNFDLTKHTEFSNQNMEYLDPKTNEKYIPYCIEPSVGADRLFLAIFTDAYCEEKIDEDDSRIVLKLKPSIAPYKACILPLSKKLSDKADEIYSEVSKEYMTAYDDSGSIGKRYRRQDEIGTPFCITIDFDTLEDNKVTIRDRDTMKQDRIDIEKINEYISEKLK